ncbi:hypothetical protein Tco_1373790, partial [Tanacetum coccineum]
PMVFKRIAKVVIVVLCVGFDGKVMVLDGGAVIEVKLIGEGE